MKLFLKMAMIAISNRKSVASNVAKKLGITTTTLYAYVNGDGSLKDEGEKILKKSINKKF